MFDDEHHGQTVAESIPEMGIRLHWLALSLLALAGCGGNAGWAWTTLAVMSLLGFALLIANRELAGLPLPRLALRAAGWMLPVWIAIAVLAIGLSFPDFAVVTSNGQKFWQLLPPPSAWMPGAGPIKISALDTLLSVGLFTAVLSAMLLCKSRLVFARAWATLLFSAAGFAFLGLVQVVTKSENILWIIPVQNARFFSTFTHPAQWSAFALLWMAAGLGLVAWLVRQRGWRWLSGEGWAILASTIVLALTIALTGDPLHQLLAMLVGATGCFVIAWQTRAMLLKAGKASASFGMVTWAAAGVVLFGGAALIATRHPLDEWIRYADGGLPMHERIIEDTKTMWRQRPWFGWGAGTFRLVYSFFQGADQSPLYVAYARSDFWQSLAEHGLIGTLAWWVPAAWVMVRLAWRRRLATFLIAPLAGVLAIAALSVVDFPLQSPAVFFSFWLLLMCLGRWSEVDLENTSSKPSEKRRMEALRAKGQTLPPKPAPAAS